MKNKTNQFFSSKEILKLAFKTEFIKRSSYKIDPYFLLLSFFDVLSNGNYSLRQWACTYNEKTKKSISFQAIAKRFSPRYLSFLDQVLVFLLNKNTFKSSNFNKEILKNFNRVIVADSTCIKLCNSLFGFFSGSKNQAMSKTITRIQVAFDIKNSSWINNTICTYKNTDNHYSPEMLKLVKKGDLVLRDLGYWNIKVFKSFIEQGIYFLSKFKIGTVIFDHQHKPINIMGMLKKYDKHGVKQFDFNCKLGLLKIDVRLVGYKLDQNQSKKKMEASIRSRHKDQKMSKLAIYLTTWNLFISNIEPEKCNVQNLIDIYKLRWFIEIIFKNWKSNFNYEKIISASVGPDPIKPEIMVYLYLIYFAAIFQPTYNLLNERLQRKYKVLLSPLRYATRIKQKLHMYMDKLLVKVDKKFIEEELKILKKYYCYEINRNRKNMGEMIFQT